MTPPVKALAIFSFAVYDMTKWSAVLSMGFSMTWGHGLFRKSWQMNGEETSSEASPLKALAASCGVPFNGSMGFLGGELGVPRIHCDFLA